jgi:hypothetical protein
MGHQLKIIRCFLFLKIIKTLNADKKRGLLSAHSINILNNMFVKHPVEYKKIETRDPLKFTFVIIMNLT